MVDRIVFHAGTPKTGTTALQIALERDRAELASRGVLYPKTMATLYAGSDGKTGIKPKHQWLVEDLVAPGGDAFAEHMAAILAQAPPSTHTVILSTEGIYNHWWDFSTAGRAALSALTRAHQVELWVWFRDPIGFFVSNYVQMLKNPRMHVACYGRDWSPERMLDDPWFAKRLDYAEFMEQASETLGPGAVRAFGYRGTTVTDFLAALGLPIFEGEPREHATLGEFGVEVLRLVNRRTLSTDAKMKAVNLISQLDAQLGTESQPFQLEAPTRERIRARCGPGLERLKREHRLDLTG